MACRVILMIEEEQPEGLSARKLVVETSKHNVLTAYNGDEGIDLLQRFPNIDAVLVHARVLEKDSKILERVRILSPNKPIILASPGGEMRRPEVTYVVDSHQPHQLVELLRDKLHADISNP
jgi:response regulator RpfG family c-di-GMP phosphodiesterase